MEVLRMPIGIMDWKRPVYFEYYDEEGVQQVKKKLEISIMGEISKNSDQKSFHFETKNKYEKENLKYKFFKDSDIESFESISYRCSGNDWENGSLCRDAIIQNIVKDKMDLDCHEYQPTVLYINGDYFGIQNLREKLNYTYCTNHHSEYNEEDIDFLKLENDDGDEYIVAKTGDLIYYNEMVQFFTTHNMADTSSYLMVKEKYIDIDAFINYYITQIYASNNGWPHNNIRLWRPRIENGKFRWILFDTDFGYSIWGAFPASMDNISIALNNHGNSFFSKKMKNRHFKNEFIQRLAYHVNTTYSDKRLSTIANHLESKIIDERENYSDFEWTRYSDYNNSVEAMINWDDLRREFVQGHINRNFGYKDWAELSIEVANIENGHVALCTQKLDASYTGLHYMETPIRLEAIPAEGSSFTYWADI